MHFPFTRQVVFTCLIFLWLHVIYISARGQQHRKYPLPQNDSFDLWPAISIVAVGDIMLASWVIPLMEQEGPLYPFKSTKVLLQSADVAIANLEAPFADSGRAYDKKFTFRVPTQYAVGLKQAGFDVLNLANNHILDYGWEGLASTLQILDKLEIKHSGAGADYFEASKPAIVQVGDKKLAFFGFSMTYPKEFYATTDSCGTAYPWPDSLVSLLETWEDSVDFSIVSFHWSAEKRDHPKDYQVYFAHLAIDHGADLVIGHHPHVLQGLELYKNRLIAYSLGNFAFGSYSARATDSIILKVYLNKNGLFYARCIPINVDNRIVEFQPRIFSKSEGRHVISQLQQLSYEINGQNILSKSGLILGNWANFYQAWRLSNSFDERPEIYYFF